MLTSSTRMAYVYAIIIVDYFQWKQQGNVYSAVAVPAVLPMYFAFEIQT